VTEPVVVLSWLVVAHLVGDFVLQTGRMAADKQRDGVVAWRAIRDHALGVAAAMLPFVIVFGLPAVALVVVVAVLHALVDRTKVVLNRRAEAEALANALRRYGTLVGSGGLGTAWTPVPAALFVIDQLVHLLVLAVGWFVLLRGASTTGAWDGLVALAAGGADAAMVRAVGLDAAVAIALAIVNVRAASLLIATLVSPREVSLGEPPVEPPEDAPAATPPARAGSTAASSGAATGAATRRGTGAGATTATPRDRAARRSGGPGGPARIGEAIGVLERLLVVIFVLTGSLAAIGFVVAAKTLARFKQLDDREFAEYYLLGTLASVSVALFSALLGAAALGIMR
jgi:hypothetical protein